MKILLTFSLLTLLCFSAFADGLSVSIENDIFTGSDNNYSHATEIKWNMSHKTNDVFLTSIGIRQFFYTPDDILLGNTIRPYERDYCGVAEGFYQMWKKETVLGEPEYVMYELDFGVMGPLALGAQTQSYAHRIIPGNVQPRGWDNQMPNEPIINAYMERHHNFVVMGDRSKWSIVTDGVYGGSLGTTWVNTFAGAEIKMGWNIPDFVSDNTFTMKSVNGELEENSNFYAYLKFEAKEYAQAFNSTLGPSLFQDHPYGRTLTPMFTENSEGLVVGYGNFSLCYLLTKRSAEFYGQAKPMDYGTLLINFGTTF